MPPVLSIDNHCPECANGASGLIGHKYIVVDRGEFVLRSYGLRFRCVLCGSFWRRSRASGDQFSWHRDEPALADGAPGERSSGSDRE